jgi:hypothetical protein
MDACFVALDADRDGRLSYAEMARELMALRVREAHFGANTPAPAAELAGLYGALFACFDRDGDGAVDRHEFHAEMREVMLAVASGLRVLPVQMVVEEGSLLKGAIDREMLATTTTTMAA